MERPIDIQLEKLRNKLIKMCSLVDEQVSFAIKSFEENNSKLALLVIERDPNVDKYDDKIEKVCQKIFALNHPVALDLRLIMSALKINTNLERISDRSVNIARIYNNLGSKPDFFSKLHFNEISKLTKQMLKYAIDSYIYSDAETAKRIIGIDNKLDELVNLDSKLLINIMKESNSNIEPGLLTFSLLQELERIGDHSTNIGEEVYFIVKAESIRHRNGKDTDLQI
ncbi:MAG: phosphate signaling complex protein PhoU [bacterium]